ncbi:MAG: SAF domain-containing protein [bacterium]
MPRRLRPPSWFDLRLVLGIGLVLASVVAGALVMARADRTRPVLAVARDLDAGTVLTAADVRTARVRLDAGRDLYLEPGAPVAGRMLVRAVRTGELLPRAALGEADPQDVTVKVAVEPARTPSLERGDRIAVLVSTKFCRAPLAVVGDVTVQEVVEPGSGAFGTGSDESLVIRTGRTLALRAVNAQALPDATITVIRLGAGRDDRANSELPGLSACLDPAKPA